jgi:hypothetical protein
VGNTEVVPELIRYFENQSDCVVVQVGQTEIEVSLIGSYRIDRHDAAVERRLAVFWAKSNGRRQPVVAGRVNGKGDRSPDAA